MKPFKGSWTLLIFKKTERTYKLPGTFNIILLLSNMQTWENNGEWVGWGGECRAFVSAFVRWNYYLPLLPSQSKESNWDSRCETALSPSEQTLYLAIMYPRCKPEETSLWDFWQPRFWPGVKRIKIIMPSIPKTWLPFSQTLMIPALGQDSIS